jgi:hypothetical protein
MLGPFLIAALQGNATVQSLVGPAIYDTTAAQGQLPPFIVFEEFDGERFSQMGGDANIVDCRVRLHLWALTVPDRDSLITAVRQTLQRYSGTLAGTQVDDIFVEAGGPTFYDSTLRAYHAVRDFRVIYRESGPTES